MYTSRAGDQTDNIGGGISYIGVNVVAILSFEYSNTVFIAYTVFYK